MAEITHTADEYIVAVSMCERERFMTLRNASFLENQSQISLPKIQKVSPVLSSNEKLKKFFQPMVLAIGPIHHDSERLKRADDAKLKLASSFIKTQGVREEVAYEKIKSQINYLRGCYEEEDVKKYNDEELAWMFFVDGCAVLQVIYNSTRQKWEKFQSIKIDLLIFSHFDILLLENQLPYKVLELLVSSTFKAEKLKEAINNFIDWSLMTTDRDEKEQDQPPTPPGEAEETTPHLLGLLRAKLLSNGRHERALTIPEKVEKRVTKFRNVSEIRDAGIAVRPSKRRSLKDISFETKFWGYLNIPRLIVDDSTAFKFMNLAAYEMCPDFSNDFEVTCYLRFLACLVDSAEDVKELRASGVILNYLDRDEQVCNLINDMSSPLLPDIGMYSPVLLNGIHRFCNEFWMPFFYGIYLNYFSSPWSFVGFLAAAIGLVLTGINAGSALKDFLEANHWTVHS